LALDYTLAVPELLAGALAAGLGATTAVVARARLRISWRWLRLAWRPAAQMLPDTVMLIVALWRRLVRRREVTGSLRVLRFDAGGDGPTDAARRGLAEAAGSLAPNTYVVGVDRDADVIVVHQLVATGRRVDADPLELGMNSWLIAAMVLLVTLIPCGVVCARASLLEGLVALELTGTVAAVVFVLLAEGFHRPAFGELAIVLAAVSFVGALGFVRYLERWL
ncbi:MAG: monovalent cation/H+ antiporter complex subunit F, partial [Acidimicrobiales bacterium]